MRYHQVKIIDSMVEAILSIRVGCMVSKVNTIHNLNRLYCRVNICTSFLSRGNLPQRNRYPFFTFASTSFIKLLRCRNTKFISQPVGHFFMVKRAIPSSLFLLGNKFAIAFNRVTKSIFRMWFGRKRALVYAANKMSHFRRNFTFPSKINLYSAVDGWWRNLNNSRFNLSDWS